MKKIPYHWAVPLALLVLCIASFGVMIPWLGFYWDDWPVLLTYSWFGADGLWQFYSYDRPASAWTYIATFPILGFDSFSWHIFSLLLRWGTAVFGWVTLLLIWPNRRREAALVSCLFVIYPVFTQQSTSVAYSQHWLSYLFLFASFALMLLAVRRPQWYLRLTLPALAFVVLHAVTMEYFMGLEMLRPILLWMIFSEMTRRVRGTSPTLREQFRFISRQWLPYLLVFLLILIWRFVYVDFPEEPANAPLLLYQLLESPGQGLVRLAQIVLQDSVYALFSVWGTLTQPNQIDLGDVFLIFSWVIALLATALALYLVGTRRTAPIEEVQQSGTPWWAYAFFLGAAALLFGVMPVWLTDRQIIRGAYSDRFILAGMMGTSLILIGGLEWFTPKRLQKNLILAVLICLSVASHLRNANEYRWSWISQTRFYWQLAWRAPYIEPQTAIFSDGEIFSYVGLYSTSSAINLLYPNPNPTTDLPYYFYSLGRTFAHQMPDFLAGFPIGNNIDFRHYQSTSHTHQGIVIHYDPAENDCLHLLSPEDAAVPDLPAVTVQALPVSDLSRIHAQTPGNFSVPTDIFGPEPEHGWCYIYQKADLARQLGDWQQVVTLGDLAAEQGYTLGNLSSNTPYEWLPFIEGYARAGRWDEAREITADVLENDPRMQTRLCELWKKIDPQAQEPGCP